MQKKTVTFKFDVELADSLKKHSKDTRIPQVQIVKLALENYMKEKENK